MRRILILPDIHAPLCDWRALYPVLKYASDVKWDEVVQLGDLVDFNSVSGHNEGRPGLVENDRVADELDAASEVIDAIRDAVGKARGVVLKGNHEWRWDRFVEKHPVLEGLVNIADLLPAGWKLVECYPKGEVYRAGHLAFTHGAYCNKHHAMTHADHYGCNIVYGHTHTVQNHTKVAYGKGKAYGAWSMGCLARLDMPYLEGRPTAWQHAFGEAFIHDDGTFNLYTTVVTNGGFTGLNGRCYGYRDIARKSGGKGSVGAMRRAKASTGPSPTASKQRRKSA